MRFTFLLPLLILLLAPLDAIALTGPAIRADWALGTPSLTVDGTTTCNNQATTRFDWSFGKPAVIYDATATCTAAAAPTSGSGTAPQVIWWEE